MTYPLIEIKSVPIEIEMRVTDAKLEYSRSTVDMEITRDKGGMSIRSKPIRVNLDTFEARNSVMPTLATQIRNSAQAGKQAAYEATATYAQQGQLLLKAKIGEELITKFAADAQTKNLKTNVGIRFIPTQGPDISWDKGELNIRYEMDKMNFDWRNQHGDFKFTPGDIQITVTQQPDVLIKYVGGALYVPPSADPDYTPIDVEA
ncbi:hypothetical protein DSECCO2_298000 [anaerobic digester metagenome]|jgi:hypothetical protein|uniref:DUF6470 family protein n=1 Tax=Oscillibacter ruminantium TaxID=1263547 RepID=UPI002B20B010|nr:DUF6470 family protein [Oscillibacter ruminantium]MEA5041210.1 DUF6470 family protein [Oscillibacter ruminantium]